MNKYPFSDITVLLKIADQDAEWPLISPCLLCLGGCRLWKLLVRLSTPSQPGRLQGPRWMKIFCKGPSFHPDCERRLEALEPRSPLMPFWSYLWPLFKHTQQNLYSRVGIKSLQGPPRPFGLNMGVRRSFMTQLESAVLGPLHGVRPKAPSGTALANGLVCLHFWYWWCPLKKVPAMLLCFQLSTAVQFPQFFQSMFKIIPSWLSIIKI